MHECRFDNQPSRLSSNSLLYCKRSHESCGDSFAFSRWIFYTASQFAHAERRFNSRFRESSQIERCGRKVCWIIIFSFLHLRRWRLFRHTMIWSAANSRNPWGNLQQSERAFGREKTDRRVRLDNLPTTSIGITFRDLGTNFQSARSLCYRFFYLARPSNVRDSRILERNRLERRVRWKPKRVRWRETSGKTRKGRERKGVRFRRSCSFNLNSSCFTLDTDALSLLPNDRRSGELALLLSLPPRQKNNNN